ncbi:MAG: orotidine-5'-phosphate decarboxylase [Alphaproteobacteria bacterium]|nr:orotidine-5'-phosphate decarboxylase [Alphaproteobacteria bacterium]
MPKISAADPASRIYCAIDTPDVARAADLATRLAGTVGGIKLGLEFFSAQGPDGVARVQAAAPGTDLFLDLKYHDIPNTVAAAMRAAAALGPRIVNVHATGGKAMMAAARDAAGEGAAAVGKTPPLVIAVTVLTSLDTDDIERMGVIGGVEEQVVRLATLAREAGLDGVVCSAREIVPIRRALGPDFILVTPGIRPAGSDAGDQKRVMTPTEAMAAGADYLVIGRPITGGADPAAAARAIAAAIHGSARG